MFYEYKKFLWVLLPLLVIGAFMLGRWGLSVKNAHAAEGSSSSKSSGAEESVKVRLKTTAGDIILRLNKAQAPISTKNFLTYVEEKFFEGTIFHRVIPSFMIQGGGFQPGMNQKKTREPIKNEAKNGLSNVRGSIAMARTQVVDSATSQFFINLKDNDFLNNGTRDYGYAVFGMVESGMDIVDKIGAVPTGTKGFHQNVPLEDVVILSAEVLK